MDYSHSWWTAYAWKLYTFWLSHFDFPLLCTALFLLSLSDLSSLNYIIFIVLHLGFLQQ